MYTVASFQHLCCLNRNWCILVRFGNVGKPTYGRKTKDLLYNISLTSPQSQRLKQRAAQFLERKTKLENVAIANTLQLEGR